ncbi:MAG: hypothetical protein H3C41_00435 [Bacteroidales bacterium]|nr:hypothetical protein [Bacteroidales bacterium]
MKTRFYTHWGMMALMMAALLISSCKKDDDGGGGGSAAEGTITAKVDGTRITTISMATFATKGPGYLNLQGNTGGTSAKAITFTILGDVSVGTYSFGGGANIANSAAYMETQIDLANPTQPVTNTWQAPYDGSVAGEIKISEITDAHIIGTFHFKGKSEDGSIKNVTDGAFNVNFLAY